MSPGDQTAPSWECSLLTCDGPRYSLTGNNSEKKAAENILRAGPGSRPTGAALSILLYANTMTVKALVLYF